MFLHVFVQLLAEALVALLPGLDANDETKTLAVIHLYAAVLSTAPGIGSESELEGGCRGVSLSCACTVFSSAKYSAAKMRP